MATPGVVVGELENEALCDATLYRQIVGALMHVMVVSRPDLSFAVGRLAASMQNPSAGHLVAAKRVLRYLKGTASYYLHYLRGGD